MVRRSLSLLYFKGDFCMFLPTQMRVCKLNLSTSALFTMTALRATSIYVKLMSNTIEVPDNRKDGNWQAQLVEKYYSHLFHPQLCELNLVYPVMCDRLVASNLWICGGGSPHQWWNYCMAVESRHQPTAWQSRCHGSDHQEWIPLSLKWRHELGLIPTRMTEQLDKPEPHF